MLNNVKLHNHERTDCTALNELSAHYSFLLMNYRFVGWRSVAVAIFLQFSFRTSDQHNLVLKSVPSKIIWDYSCHLWNYFWSSLWNWWFASIYASTASLVAEMQQHAIRSRTSILLYKRAHLYYIVYVINMSSSLHCYRIEHGSIRTWAIVHQGDLKT